MATPDGERLAALEATQEHTLNAIRAMHSDLKKHMKDETRRMDIQDRRIAAVEAGQVRNANNISWIKRIGIGIVAFLSSYVYIKVK